MTNLETLLKQLQANQQGLNMNKYTTYLEEDINQINIFLARINNMKYVFAGNWLEYTQFVERQEKNGFTEISKVEHLNKIKIDNILIVTGSYRTRNQWPGIEKAAREKGILIEEQ